MQLIRLTQLTTQTNMMVFLGWSVKYGEKVLPGQPLFEITIDKVAIQVDSEVEGYLVCLLAQPGDLVAVDSVLGVVSDTKEEPHADMREMFPAFSPAPPLRISCNIAPNPGDRIIPLDSMRRIIAQRMSHARSEIPHFYLTATIDMTNAMKLRDEMKNKQRIRISYNDMLLKASGLALRNYPQVASLYTPAGIVRRNRMHVGFAVATQPDGLVVPVIRDADQRALSEISGEARGLAQRSRNKKLTPDDYGYGVFTVSNLGTYDVNEFTAIINPANAAILAVGKIYEKVVADNHKIAIRSVMNVTLSSDHRIIDGALAARFCSNIRHLMESPRKLLEDTRKVSVSN